jgi:hypothetical protein
MEKSNWGGACPSWIVEIQKKNKNKMMMMKMKKKE